MKPGISGVEHEWLAGPESPNKVSGQLPDPVPEEIWLSPQGQSGGWPETLVPPAGVSGRRRPESPVGGHRSLLPTNKPWQISRVLLSH